LQDAQRAARLVRAREGGSTLLAVGFSAGGHLVGSLATRFAEPVYAPVDDVDRLSARPDCVALAYPVTTMHAPHAHAGSRRNLIGDAPSAAMIARYSLETAPPADTAPTLIFHAADDRSVPVENALMLYEALRRAGIASALHIFEDGGHGFGMRGIENTPRAAWPGLVLDWGRAHRA
jgi:acetyl esterase/lipase